MPAKPHMAGNPVCSVHQTTSFGFGVDLADCLRNELASRARRRPEMVRPTGSGRSIGSRTFAGEVVLVKFDNGRGAAVGT